MMRSRYTAAILAILFFTLVSWNFVTGEKGELLINLILQGLDSNHYTALQIDDKFSEDVYDMYVDRLDVSKRFLLKEDVKKMEFYRKQIDDEIKVASYDFFELSEKLLVMRTKAAEKYWQDILAKPFDFTIKEDYETDAEKMGYAKDEKELKDRWRKALKWQTMQRLIDIMEVQEKAIEDNDTSVTRLSAVEMEEKAREKVRKSHEDWFRRLNKLDTDDHRATYLNCVANVYDPHTGYFPPEDKANFDINLSGRLEGIGATLQEKAGYVTVNRIVPGSACYRQGQLEVEDVILKVAQGAAEPVDVVDMQLDDVVKLIRGKKGSEVRLTVKKEDGTIMVIPIIRDVVILEETYAKSATLKSDNYEGKIGYINLPKFYADFQNKDGRQCAIDVATEIEKLKGEGIQSLIFDLRNNGGGSLNDVVTMSGLFIETGPIVQVNNRNGKPQIMRDRDPSVQYDGPMVILVNEFSASASEIMAAAMQDYHRAVIVGSPQTYGKGTVQRFFDLDRMVASGADELKPLGSVKLTTQKFYRINGGSTQLKGVASDIVIPDIFSKLEVGEKELEHVMPWDEIAPVSFNKWNAKWDAKELARRSAERIKNNPLFATVEEQSDIRKANSDQSVYSLHLETYRKEMEIRNKQAEELKEASKPIDGLDPASLLVDIEAMGTDTVKTKLAEKWRANLKKDAYIYEACAILQDMK
ncbi:MAG: carboxy terminal-processing peptidase [Bacteroidia bacterium]|nr:carboxy terminal-processing peptidase [Bacteroidia bacterium]